MFGTLRRWLGLYRRSTREPRISVDGDPDGFRILDRLGFERRILWSSVVWIAAYKVDLLTIDSIRLSFRLQGVPEEVLSSEDWPGFAELRSEVERRYEIDPAWWDRVMKPAFAENLEVLWEDTDATSGS